MTLDQLQPGQRALIRSFIGDDVSLQRLMEMGLLENEEVELIAIAPFGDPIEIRLRDYRLSLGRHEASRICITLVS